MGNPNVGKSVFFSRITGVNVIASNYPGTTVEFTKGFLKLGEERVEVIDVPGTYALEPTSKAEEVAAEMLRDGDLVIDILDATNLERNLFLTLELAERHVPMIVALNIWDDTRHRGIHIDANKLEELLGVPVVPTVANVGKGLKDLVEAIAGVASGTIKTSPHHFALKAEIREALNEVVPYVKKLVGDLPNVRWIAMRLLEGDTRIREALENGELASLAKSNSAMEQL